MSEPHKFTDPEFLSKLERLAHLSKKMFASDLTLESRGHGKRGVGSLFQEHRRYSAGDDFRSVDWNVYGRLGELFVKVFEPEERTALHLYLDSSKSMEIDGKLRLAREIIAALGYLGLRNMDRVRWVAVPSMQSGEYEGHEKLELYLREIEQIDSQRAETGKPIRDSKHMGFHILISDFYPLQPLEKVLTRMGRGHKVCVHLIEPDDTNIPSRGAFQFLDAETNRSRWIGVHNRLSTRYRELLHSHYRAVSSMCAQYGSQYLRASTQSSFESVVLEILRLRT